MKPLPDCLTPNFCQRVWRKKRQPHTTPTKAVLNGFTEQAYNHIGPGWTAAVIFDDGNGITLTADERIKLPPRRACDWMENTVYQLNLRINHGGHWVVGWAINGEPVLLWRDEDGDIHVVIEIAGNANNLHEWGIDRVEVLAEQGWHQAHERVKALDLAKRQQINLAAGEKPSA